MVKKIIQLLIFLSFSPALHAGEWVNMPPNEWNYSIEDWSFIESELKIKIEKEALNRKDPVSNWNSYNFQYTYVINNGKKVIYINGFCDSMGFQWHTQQVLIEDGGSCFFQAYFDPHTNNILDVFINGHA